MATLIYPLELSSQVPFALLWRTVCLKTCLPTHSLILTTKISLHSGGTTAFVILLPRASNSKAQRFLRGENQASNSRQGHGVTTVSLHPQRTPGPFPPGVCGRVVNPHTLSQTVKWTENWFPCHRNLPGGQHRSLAVSWISLCRWWCILWFPAPSPGCCCYGALQAANVAHSYCLSYTWGHFQILPAPQNAL